MTPFQIALNFTLRWEGGYVHHEKDPGGATMMGITQATYDGWRQGKGLSKQPVKSISQDEVEQIYYENYWLRAGCDQTEPLALAVSIFDMAVNSGVGTALSMKAQTGNWVLYNAKRLAYLAALHTLWPTFGRGWANRVAALNEYVANLTGTPPPSGLIFQALGEHDTWVDNSPTVGKGMAMLSAALSRKPAIFRERVRVSRTRRQDGWKLDIAKQEQG